jgi:Fe-S cluster assembly scaffold protein SufB
LDASSNKERITMTDKSQFHHLGGFGRSPRKNAPQWSCIAGITREGARIPGAANHIKYPRAPKLLYGCSPLEAGRLATERADQAYDHGRRRRRLRRDGIALLAAVASYPVPRHVVENDSAEQATYRRWSKMTLDWTIEVFGEHLLSVVEHADENFLHLHYYVVPKLRPDGRLDLHEIHPGRRAKRDAAEVNACKKYQDAAYRSAMARWQDDYWYEVSRNFGHGRYGPKRARVSRMRHMMEKRMEEAKARQEADLAAECEKFEREMAQRRAEQDRAPLQIVAAVRQDYETAIGMLRVACVALKGRVDAERAGRQAAEAEAERLRARLAALEEEAPLRFVA